MKKIAALWFTIFYCLVASLVSAQQPPVVFEHLTARDGLLGNNVRSIIQDRQGYIWIGTYGGISRFDGYTFKGYSYNAWDTSTLGGNHVIDLWEDPSGYIWAAISNGGLARLDPRTGRVKRYMANRSQSDGLHTNDVTAVRGDHYGDIWVGTVEGLCRFSPKTETFTRYIHNPEDSTTLGTNSMISDLHVSQDGTVWVATIDRGVNRINRKTGPNGEVLSITFTRFEHDPANSRTISSNQVMDVFEDHTGSMWFGTLNGFNRFDKRTGHRIGIYTHDVNNSASISSSEISQRTIDEDQQGNLWIGTSNGLNRLNSARTHFERFYHDPASPNSIGDNIIRAIRVDRTGIVWLGSNDAGISKFDPSRRMLTFKGFQHSRSNPMKGYNIRSVCEDNAKKIWIGTEGGGVFRYDPTTTQFRNFRTGTNGLSTNFIGPMLKDQDGIIWIGLGSDWNSGTTGEIARLDPVTGQFTIYLPFKAPHSYAFILSIFEDERGLLWFGTGNMGTITFDRKRARWKQYAHVPGNTDGLSGKWSRAVVSDRNGNIWIGTDAGLDRLEFVTGHVSHFINNPADTNSLSSNYILSLCVDKKGRLWIGSDGGISRYDPDGQKFILYSEQNGLINNTVANILEDNDGNLWLNTVKGLCRFSPETGVFTAFDSDNSGDNYFISGNVHVGAAFKSHNGTLYFGGKTSIAEFHPHDIRFNRNIPPVVLTGLRLFDKSLAGTFDRQTLTLDHDKNSLTFEFAALNYTSTTKNQYAYRLDNFQSNWIYANSQRAAAYTNLSPGTYIFRVKGSNNDGIWNEKGTFMTVIIKPAWWQTVWFRIFILSIIICVLFSFYRYRISQVRSIQVLRDQIARDLHDDVGGVLSSISFYSEAASAMHLEGRYQDSYHILQKIAVNARATIERMSDVVWSMRSDTNNALQLAERLESFGNELLGHRNISLKVEKDDLLDSLLFPPDVIRNLYLICKEAIHNAAKHSAATEIWLTVRQTNGKLELTVKDNGRGITDPGDGSGLENMKKRADGIDATYRLSTFPDQGTEIHVRR